MMGKDTPLLDIQFSLCALHLRNTNRNRDIILGNKAKATQRQRNRIDNPEMEICARVTHLRQERLPLSVSCTSTVVGGAITCSSCFGATRNVLPGSIEASPRAGK